MSKRPKFFPQHQQSAPDEPTPPEPAPPSAPVPAPPDPPTTEPEPAPFVAIAMPRVPGGYAVVSMVIQGNRVVERTVHLERAETHSYACMVAKTVMQQRVMYPSRTPIINLGG